MALVDRVAVKLGVKKEGGKIVFVLSDRFFCSCFRGAAPVGGRFRGGSSRFRSSRHHYPGVLSGCFFWRQLGGYIIVCSDAGIISLSRRSESAAALAEFS